MTAQIFNIQKFSLHDGPGIRTSIFFLQMQLELQMVRKPECHETSSELFDYREYGPQELLAEVLKDKVFYDKSGGGVTLTGGEIFMQFEFVRSFCELLKQNGINITIETSGAAEEKKFQEISGLVDFIYIDCKHYDPDKHKYGTGISNEIILQNIGFLASSEKKYCVRIPVIPGFNDSLSDASEFCRLFQRLGVDNVELLPFHQFGESKYSKIKTDYAYAGVKQLNKEDLTEYIEIFDKTALTY